MCFDRRMVEKSEDDGLVLLFFGPAIAPLRKGSLRGVSFSRASKFQVWGWCLLFSMTLTSVIVVIIVMIIVDSTVLFILLGKPRFATGEPDLGSSGRASPSIIAVRFGRRLPPKLAPALNPKPGTLNPKCQA